ncbi:hypothetical protein [Olleya sp. 1-3]|uniref:hypothetical protein n=1 Tax=Olleya sp. 1-3 TaxID=2058323 RepID=UPI000C3344FD|nr:hypothetical protein [Olleya sp. 1-3]PKG50721.1 hypothetical protein CXF54_11230 [Olleya sp. 1-3]
MDNSSFEKGEKFEGFVEKHLFPESDYDLIHRTDSFSQNSKRYSENTLKPDFKLRCKKSKKEFYIEAKYRSCFNSDDKVEIISFPQLERFRKIQADENIIIFIAVGLEGTPENPDKISLIPLNELAYLKLYPSFINKFKIEKNVVANEIINLYDLNYEKDKKENSAKENENKKSTKQRNILLITLLLLIISASSFYAFYETTESKIRKKTAEYYQHVENGDLNALKNYIAPKVNNWYDKSNLTFEEIKTEAHNYLKKYPKSSTDIQWDTFKFSKLGEDYLCTYNLVYKIQSKNKFKDKIFHLKIKSTWGKDLKIKSIIEDRL